MNLGVFLPFSEGWVTSGSVELDLFLPKVVNSKGKEMKGVVILGDPLTLVIPLMKSSWTETTFSHHLDSWDRC